MKLNRSEWPIWTAVFLDLCGFAAIIVDIQFRAERMGAPGWKIGVILASTFVIQSVLSPFWGRVSDKHGRRNVFLACTAISCLSMAIYAVALDPWWLLVSRIVAGGGAANTAIAQAAIADAFPSELRGPAIGRLSAAINLGLILGPTLGGWIAAGWGSASSGWFGFAASGTGLLVALAFAEMKPGGFEQSNRRYAFGSLIKDYPSVAPYFMASVAAWFSLAMLEGTFGRLLKERFQLGAFEFGVIFAYESVIGVAVSAFLLGWLLKQGREKLLLAGSYVMMGAGLALMPIAPSYFWIFGASFLYAFGQGFASPAVATLCSNLVEESRQGELFGLMQGARSIGFVLGPVLGGALFDRSSALPYYGAGIVCLGAAMVVGLAKVRRTPPAPAT